MKAAEEAAIAEDVRAMSASVERMTAMIRDLTRRLHEDRARQAKRARRTGGRPA